MLASMLEGKRHNYDNRKGKKHILPGAKIYFHNRIVLLLELLILHIQFAVHVTSTMILCKCLLVSSQFYFDEIEEDWIGVTDSWSQDGDGRILPEHFPKPTVQPFPCIQQCIKSHQFSMHHQLCKQQFKSCILLMIGDLRQEMKLRKHKIKELARLTFSFCINEQFVMLKC